MMDTILFVNACVYPKSRTMILAQNVLAKLGGRIEEVNLQREKIAPMGAAAGLCRARQLFYVTTAGGSIAEPDYGFGYVKALAGNFYGIPHVKRFYAENLDIDGADAPAILQKAMDEIDTWAETLSV